MPPNPKVVKAFRAMKALGIAEDKVKPVLKNLLKVYDKRWELIEEENYRALIDAIFESEEAEAAQPKKLENNERKEALDEEATQEEPERPLKRLRLKYQEGQPSPSCNNASTTLTGTSLKKPKVEVDEISNDHRQSRSQGMVDLPQLSNGGRAVQSQPAARKKGKQPISPNSQPMRQRDRGKEHQAHQPASQKTSGILALIKPKDEPYTDDMPQFEVPIAVLPPESMNEADAPNGNLLLRGQGAPETLASESHMGKDARNYTAAAPTEMVSNQQLARIEDESSSNLEVASSSFGEVKISINCVTTAGGTDFRLPSLDAVLKLVEDKCLRSYKILDPNFSVMSLMKDMCECVLELGTKSIPIDERPIDERPETTSMMKAINQLETSLMEDDFDSRPPDSANEPINFGVDEAFVLPEIPNMPLPCNGVHDGTLPEESASGKNRDGVADNAQNDLEQTNSQSPISVEPCQLSSQKTWSLHEVIDITNGQEKLVISIVNEVNSECPPSFHYIMQNVVFQNANVNFSLARIGDNHCCPTCSGDCLSLPVPCACAQQKRGGFAYTIDGLIREKFLNDCISMNQDPKKNTHFCKNCPLERSKNDDLVEPCKGHLSRTFIKECWWRCGCSKQCGNRVVQRGISRKLQVFMTSEGKGWGLRTLEDLTRGTFVCEYVGEVLTNAEFFCRVSRSPDGEKHSYPVLLDANWGSGGGMLKDEEALCLDATYYGNVARFINHRCFDSNLVEIPIEIESPDHHYYHLAFFTTRDVKAMEELTWDYGIDFDDLDHPIKAFRCQCGSQFCRNIKRLSRSRARR